MTTPLYPTFRKRIHDAFENLIRRQVTPWSFLTSGRPFRIQYFDGKQIAYEGVGFEGSPRDVFWSRYIEPFLEDIAIREIEAAVSQAKERGIDARQLLPEVQTLLSAGFRRVYARMTDVDRRLRGRGFPDKVAIRPVEREIAVMDEFLGERIKTELAMWQPKAITEYWFERNKFWVWIVGITVSVVALVISLWAKFG